MRSISFFKSKYKKGQVQSIAPAILGLIFAGLILIFGLVILQSLRGSDIVDSSISVSTVNESTTTVVNEVGYLLVGGGAPGANSFSVDYCMNTSSSTVIPSTNYTITDYGLIQTNEGVNVSWNDSLWDCSYTYKHGDTTYAKGNLTLVGLGTFADFWEIIVLAIVISVVMGLLLVVFAGGRKR